MLPFEHGEDLAIQDRGVELFAALRGTESGDKSYDSMLKHRQIIADFGRFPHRNEILGRHTTPEESAFLKQPNSSF